MQTRATDCVGRGGFLGRLAGLALVLGAFAGSVAVRPRPAFCDSVHWFQPGMESHFYQVGSEDWPLDQIEAMLDKSNVLHAVWFVGIGQSNRRRHAGKTITGPAKSSFFFWLCTRTAGMSAVFLNQP